MSSSRIGAGSINVGASCIPRDLLGERETLRRAQDGDVGQAGGLSREGGQRSTAKGRVWPEREGRRRESGVGDVQCVPERPLKMRPKSPLSLAAWRFWQLAKSCLMKGCLEWVEEKMAREEIALRPSSLCIWP